MLLFQLGCLRKYAEICFGKLSKICDMCKMFFTGLFFILWGVDQNSDPVMVLNRFGMMDIGVADECGSTLYFGRSDEVPGNVFQYCSNFTEAVSWNEYKDASIRHASYACRYFCAFVVAQALME